MSVLHSASDARRRIVAYRILGWFPVQWGVSTTTLADEVHFLIVDLSGTCIDIVRRSTWNGDHAVPHVGPRRPIPQDL